jgi:hypothetical protein
MLLESRPIEEIVLVLFVCLAQNAITRFLHCHGTEISIPVTHCSIVLQIRDRRLEHVPMITVGYIRRAMQQSVGKCYC